MVGIMETTAAATDIPEPDFKAFAIDPQSDPPVAVDPQSDPPVAPPVDPPGKRQRAPRQPRQPRQKSVVRKHVETTLAIVAMSDRQRTILEAALGGEHREIADLTTAAIEAGAKGIAAITALLEVADADPIEAGILATELTDMKAVFKAAWSVLVALHADVPATPPPGPAKAGLRLARAVQALSKETRKELRLVSGAVASA